jgi:hypothetical protein
MTACLSASCGSVPIRLTFQCALTPWLRNLTILSALPTKTRIFCLDSV